MFLKITDPYFLFENQSEMIKFLKHKYLLLLETANTPFKPSLSFLFRTCCGINSPLEGGILGESVRGGIPLGWIQYSPVKDLSLSSLRRYAPGFLFIQSKLLIIYPPGASSKPTYRGIRPTRESDVFSTDLLCTKSIFFIND